MKKVYPLLSVLLGITIPILITSFLIKRQEVIKLKAIFAQDSLKIIQEYRPFDLKMRLTTILDKNVSDLSFDYGATETDKSAPILRGLYILSDHGTFSDWRVEYTFNDEILLSLRCDRIANYLWYRKHYLLRVDLLIKDIPDSSMWEVSVALKNDFFNMGTELSNIIEDYLDNELFKLKKIRPSKKERMTKELIHNKYLDTNLYKYGTELAKLKEK